ncbi:MAG: molybdopterin-dependent oxidoreductase, partial [Clostridiales bacterium]|nr:molybdopterin-dependent oxidoreductase [Clostridiales bacterium]
MSNDATQLHEGYQSNILKKESYDYDGYDESQKQEGLISFEEEFHTPRVQHCHIENPISYAYMEGERIVIVSSTQIPHIMRRIVGQALGVNWGRIRIIKPYIGGGFGNKQDVLYEPLNAYLSMLLGGKKIKMELTREETFMCTRSRHAIDFKFKTTITPDGRLVSRYIEAISDQGGYASHGHAVVRNTVKNYSDIYSQTGGFKADVYTVYTNLGTSGAMRAYGIPQAAFACESHMENIAEKMGFDPIEFRLKNMMVKGYKSKDVDIYCYSTALEECIQKGRKYIDWDNKRKQYKNQEGNLRRGVGMSIFCYKTGVYPFAIEVSSSRITLNQDGTVQMQMGATEIGQGADTVFSQMAAETIGVNFEDVNIVSTQDTDVSPFDLGAYASRQTYVAGKAVKQTAEILKQKILEYAEVVLNMKSDNMDIVDSEIINSKTRETLITLQILATNAFYNPENAVHISAERTVNCRQNTFSFGTCFVDVEVDMEMGEIKILDIINVHDSGKIINPALA